MKRRRLERSLFFVVFGVTLLAGTFAFAQTIGDDGNDVAGIAAETVAEAPTVSLPAQMPAAPPAPATPTTQNSAAPPPAAPAGKLAGRTICIDPGHAATTDAGMEATGPGSPEVKVKDPGGTSGVVSGVREPVVNLAISLELKNRLEAEGAVVVMTRQGESFEGGNIERAAIANAAGADLFVRIHADGSTNPSQSGVSTLYPTSIPGWTDDIFAESQRAAGHVQAALVQNLQAVDGGAVPRSDMTGFNWADVPAILVECGFMTNAAEDELLNSPAYQQQIAAAIVLGIENYLA